MFSFTGKMPKYYLKNDIQEIIASIEDKYGEPRCNKNGQCIYSTSIPDYVCRKCIEWETSKSIIDFIKERINEK